MRITDVLRFAVRDLLAPGALRTTLAIGMTLSVVCAVTLAAYGLIQGAEQVGLARLGKDRLAKRMLVGDHIDTHRKLTPSVLDKLEKTIKARLPAGQELTAVSPFQVTELFWDGLDGQGRRPIRGRTLKLNEGQLPAEDPLMVSRQLRSGTGFTSASDLGVVLCPSMRGELGLSRDATLPESLTVVVNNEPVSVPVRGELDRNLPEHTHYLLTDQGEFELGRKRQNPRLKYVYTGPVDPAWLAQAEFPKEVQRVFDENNFKVIPIPKPDEKTLLYVKSLNPVDDQDHPAPYLSEWRELVDRLRTVLDKRLESTFGDGFLKLDLRDQTPAAEAKFIPPAGYDLVGLYFNELKSMETAAQVLEEDPLLKKHFDRDVREQLRGLDRERAASLAVLNRFEWVLAILVVVNLWVIQVMRASQKITEAGMLRAIGMSRTGLLTVVVLEIALVWSCAATFGLTVGWWGGMHIASPWLYENPAEAAFGFQITSTNIVWVLCGTGLISLISGLVATERWHRADPAQLLGSGG